MKLLLALAVLLASPALAPLARAASLGDLEWVQRQGAAVPMDAPLVGRDGLPTTLREAAGGLPLVLAPGYFRCPNLCGVVREDLAVALERSGMAAGRDYAVAVVSVDPAETPADAAAVQAGWHGLTGPAQSVAAVTEAVGFPARFDPALRQFLHPAGVAVLSPAGLVSGYVLGVGYDPAALRDAVDAARIGKATRANPVLLLCFDYDPATGRYTPAVRKLVQAGAVLTALGIASFLWLSHRPRGRA